MNNKGQVLVIFIILLPIFLFILAMTIDYGMLSMEKRKLDNNTYDALEYYLDNIEDEEIKEKTIKLLENNLENVEIDILDNDDYVEFTVKSNYKSLYNTITNSDLIIKYKGLKENNKIIKG